MASGYRLVTYADAGAPKAGVLLGDKIVPAASLLRGIDTSSVLGLLRNWDAAHRSLHEATANGLPPGKGVLLAQAKLLAPILYPGALYCAGANYWDHLEEMAEIAKEAAVVERLNTIGYPAAYLDGDAYREIILKDLAQWRDVAKAANIRIN